MCAASRRSLGLAALLTLLAGRLLPAVAGTPDPRWPGGVVNVYAPEGGMRDTMLVAADRWTRSGASVAIRVVLHKADADVIVREDDRRLLRAVRARLPRLHHVDRPSRRRQQRDPAALEADRRSAAAVRVGRRARARARARPAPPQRPRLLGDVAARVRHRTARRRSPRAGRRPRSWPASRRRPTSTSPPACTAAPRRRAIRAAASFPGVIASRLSRLRHDDLHRDVGARRAHRRDQPRPGLPGRGRAGRGARGRAGGDPRRPQPVRAAARRAGAARRRSPSTSSASTGSSSTRRARCR